MVKKIITDRKIIRLLVNRTDNVLIIEYNINSKRAWYKTETMLKRKAIDLSRVIDLQFFCLIKFNDGVIYKLIN